MTRHGISLGAPASLVGAGLVLLSATVAADTIKKTDGAEIDGVRVEDETLTEVVYKRGSREERLPSDEVLSVSFDKMPKDIEFGVSALTDGDYGAAEADFDGFVEAHLAGDNVAGRYDWAPAFAAWKVVDIRMTLGDLDGAVAAADRLVGSFADSRYVPMAFMAKSDALAWQGKGADAKKALDDFRRLIDGKGLSSRWGLECDLGLVMRDPSLGGEARRDRLSVIQSQAGSKFPTVRSRAQVAEGQSWVDDIVDERNPEKKLAAVGKARPIFEGILKEFKADEATLAGAYAGLGDCLWTEGTTGGKSAEKLGAARLMYLRVPILYDAQSSYVPKCLYMGGLCSWELIDIVGGDEEKEKAKLLFGRLIRDYPESPFAALAKKYR